MPETKIAITGMKNASDDIFMRFHTAKDGISEFGDLSIEISQTET